MHDADLNIIVCYQIQPPVNDFPSVSVHFMIVRIEEIVDEDKPIDENAKRAKKKKTQSSDCENSNRQIVPKAGTGVPVIESEDEDGFPVSANGNKSDISKLKAALEETENKKTSEKTKKNSGKTDAAPGKNLKRKSDEIPAR